MWTSGVTPAGSSSVPPRTNRTPGCPYWLKTATWQVGQRKIRCVLPSSRGTSTGCGSPASSSTRSVSTVGFDQQVDDESATGLPLAVQAVTAMCEERIGRKPVANRSAGAATLTWDAHDLLLEDSATESGQYPVYAAYSVTAA